MEEIDWYFIAVSAILGGLLIFGNVYMLAYYAHSQDTKFAANILMRLIVVSFIFLITKGLRLHFEFLALPLDVPRLSSEW